MNPNSAPSNPELFALWREAQDMRSRTRMGGSFYLVAWLLICMALPDSLTAARYGLVGSLFFSVALVSRWLHRFPTELSVTGLQRWINQHWAMVIVTTAGWGFVNVLILSLPDFAVPQLLAIISTIAFSTAFSFTFAMRLYRCLAVMFLLNLPGLVVLAQSAPEQRPIFLSLAIYLVYLLLSCRRSNTDYLATIALEQQLLSQRNSLEQLSRTDSLTQLGNRYQFNDLFQAMLASAHRLGSPLSLVLLDIDYFKRVNDQHGHAAGDLCLQQFAEVMRQVFRRTSDVPLRLGGEEFGVIMPGTTLEQASQLAEQFRVTLSETSMRIPDSALRITTSVGVGAYNPQIDKGADDLYKRVDAALYQAKEDGRNRLQLARG
ncbi:GGDEF domain-containing protein [Pseudomonas sp. N040]|uniref:GGDEF domain-containing protein n=1 Tax=Pseudomonas sp. N040 TaxID=2785325 RepID=UPI0018A2E457|nr:GGDEF domain-containing protein [Pseudomonas sp. N040]MBF7731068.1 GGDEF domain-containing protein [Pseudomonas sp. N040]MBW7014711.1 GGDEF domain-containing protein [Pseudomonas sp. N040]